MKKNQKSRQTVDSEHFTASKGPDFTLKSKPNSSKYSVNRRLYRLLKSAFFEETRGAVAPLHLAEDALPQGPHQPSLVEKTSSTDYEVVWNGSMRTPLPGLSGEGWAQRERPAFSTRLDADRVTEAERKALNKGKGWTASSNSRLFRPKA